MIARYYSIMCDDCNSLPFGAEMGDTAAEAFAVIKRFGWTRVPSGDRSPAKHYCPDCSKKRAA